MSGSLTRVREVAALTVVALCAAVIGGVFLGASADAFDNHQQNPVAGDPQCADLFAGSSQVRSDPPGPDPNPTGTVPAQYLTIDGFKDLVGVIVHGGASGSNVYDTTTGMGGLLIPTRNPGGGLANLEYTLICYTEYADPAMSTGTIGLVYSDSGHQVAVSVTVAVAPTTTTMTVAPQVSPAAPPTTTVAVVTTVPPFDVVPTTVPPEVDEVVQTPPPEPVTAQPTFTG